MACVAALSHASLSGAQEVNAPETAKQAEVVTIPPHVAPVLERFCIKCHKGDDADGDVRLNTLASLGKAPFLNLLNKAEAQLFFGMMPPEDARQPTAEERQLLFAWVQGELRKNNASSLDLKARAAEAGNWVDHRSLFNGSVKEKPFSPARRWLVSPQVFLQRVYNVFDLDAKFRNDNSLGLRGLTNPFVFPNKSGVRDYDTTAW